MKKNAHFILFWTILLKEKSNIHPYNKMEMIIKDKK